MKDYKKCFRETKVSGFSEAQRTTRRSGECFHARKDHRTLAQNPADEVVGKYNYLIKTDWDDNVVLDDDKAEVNDLINQQMAKLKHLSSNKKLIHLMRRIMTKLKFVLKRLRNKLCDCKTSQHVLSLHCRETYCKVNNKIIGSSSTMKLGNL